LGLHGKYARSADEATEREKAAKVKQTKRTLDKFKKRETIIIQNLTDLLHPTKILQNEAKTPEDQTLEKTVVRITRDHLDAGKRVVSITDVAGIAMDQSLVVLTSDLSLLESSMPTNATAKSFQEDAENEVPEEETPQQRSIFGVIKVFLANIQNCTILVKCKIITGTVELHNCHNVCIKVEHEATVATIQADLSSNIDIEFHDAVSGKHVPGSKKILYWGEDKDDRIFHAGISNMHVRIYRDGYLESELTADYLQDGAEQIGNSTPEEFQFVTSCLEGGPLVTEKVVRSGHTTGKNVRAMTDRELAVEKERRERAAKCALKMAEDMVQIKDKDGNVLVQKTEVVEVPEEEEEEVVEEVYTSMSKAEIESIVQECEQLKARGNEAFGAGEYGQAILHYSLSLDKAEELPDAPTDGDVHRGQSLFPRDVVYSNRAAAFLKLGQHEKAEADSEKALAINPDNVKALFRKGLALHASSRYTEALPCLAAAYKKEPKNAQIQQALKFCEVRLEQEHRLRMSKD
jgi:tetratricopeptide (TPR) repeat protein